MNKELEALITFNYIMTRCKDEDSYIIKFPLGVGVGTTFGEDMEKAYKVIKEALQRLEQIDNAEPSEALGILETFENDGLLNKEIGAISYNQIWLKNQIEVLKQELLKAQEQEKLLSIIKEYVMPLVSIDDECVWDNEGYHYRVPKKEDLILLKRYADE